jgi:hypothetical protein
MKELFLALCAVTSLNCNDVTIAYGFVGFDVQAIAVVDISNNYYIIVDNSMRRKSNFEKKQLLIHELAHLLVYENNIKNNKHDKYYYNICKDLTNKLNFKHRSICKPITNSGHSIANKFNRGQ